MRHESREQWVGEPLYKEPKKKGLLCSARECPLYWYLDDKSIPRLTATLRLVFRRKFADHLPLDGAGFVMRNTRGEPIYRLNFYEADLLLCAMMKYEVEISPMSRMHLTLANSRQATES